MEDLEQYTLISTYSRTPQRVIVHAYGPYTKKEAAKAKREFARQYPEDVKRGKLRLNVCKLFKEEPV